METQKLSLAGRSTRAPSLRARVTSSRSTASGTCTRRKLGHARVVGATARLLSSRLRAQLRTKSRPVVNSLALLSTTRHHHNKHASQVYVVELSKYKTFPTEFKEILESDEVRVEYRWGSVVGAMWLGLHSRPGAALHSRPGAALYSRPCAALHSRPQFAPLLPCSLAALAALSPLPPCRPS